MVTHITSQCRCRGATARTLGRRDPDCPIHTDSCVLCDGIQDVVVDDEPLCARHGLLTQFGRVVEGVAS